MPDDAQTPEQPRPDPALHRLDRLVGEWDLRGRSPGSDNDDITGRTRFRWLHGEGDSFFLLQEMQMDYAGTPILSHELIGHDPKTGAFASQVYSNMAAEPWPYIWDVNGDEITIAISHGPMDAKYTGRFAADGNSWSGGWRPNPGADETINAPYDITATRRA